MSHFNALPNQPVGPPPPGQVSDFSHPVDEEHYTALAVTVAVFFPLTLIFTFLRLYTRAVVLKLFGWDDVCALIALCLVIGYNVCQILLLEYGVADYDWNLRASQWQSEYTKPYTYVNAVGGLLFYLTYGFAKLSILVFYLRLLGPDSRKLRAGVYALIVMVVLILLGFFITQLLYCQPVAKVFYPHIPGTCVPESFISNFLFATVIISAISDLFILIPPIPIIWRLPTSRRRRTGLLIVFSSAFVVTGVAIARCVSIGTTTEAELKDFLYSIFLHIYLALVEINLAVIVINVPALIQLVRYIMAKRIAKMRSNVSPQSPPEQGPSSGSPAESPGSGNGSPRRGPAARKWRSPISQLFSSLVSGLDGSRCREEVESPVKETTTATIREKDSLSSLHEGSADGYSAEGSGSVNRHSAEGSGSVREYSVRDDNASAV